jgi:hypothetical protein|tara:strand:+ start:332 stop:760 length:429 start_codon:yes stop_codon:yes gene_type:complete
MGVIAIVIGGSIVLFYGQTVDVREQQARLISDKLVEVFDDYGKLRDGIVCDDRLCEGFNIYGEAGINSRIINNGEFYFGVEIFDDGKLVGSVIEGNRGFKVECFLEGDKLPKCYPEDGPLVLILDNYRVEILAGSNNLGRSV